LRDIANKLLTDRDAPHVGVNWLYNFIKRVPELRTRVNRKYDYKRALNEDPEVIQGWFRLVRNTISKYGILDDNIYNFDEAGFQMGVISTRLIITGSERRQAPKSLQPGNIEWVTTIVSANASGWAPPPFIIFKGKQHYDTWYESIADRPNWVLSVSKKGWTSLEHGFEWLKYFN
jgi:DDE superfamily endonuclease